MSEASIPTSKSKGKKAKVEGNTGPETQTYQAAYERLRQIAEELEEGQTDLDRALPLLSEAQAAYALCQERIERLQALLDAPIVDAIEKPLETAQGAKEAEHLQP